MSRFNDLYHFFLTGGKNKLSQGILWNMGSLCILAVGGILLNIIILKFSNADTLGVFNQVFAIYLILSQVSAAGIQFSVLKYVSQNQENLVECARIITSGLILSGIVSTFVVMLAFFLIEPAETLLESTEVSQGLRFALPGLIFFSLNKVLINAINGARHMRAYAIFKALRYILLLGITSFSILQNYPGTYLAYSLFWPEVFLFIAMVIYVNMKMFSTFLVKNFKKWFVRHMTFGLKGFMSGVFTTLMVRIDVLILGYFASDTLVGVYSFAATVATGFLQIPFAIRWNIDPIIGDYISRGELKKIEKLSQKIRRSFFPIMLLIGTISLILYPVMIFVVKPNIGIGTSWAVFSIIMIGVIIGSSYSPFIGIFLQGGRPGTHTLLVGGLALVNTILGILLVPILGIYGTAIAALIVNILTGLSINYFSKKIFNLNL